MKSNNNDTRDGDDIYEMKREHEHGIGSQLHKSAIFPSLRTRREYGIITGILAVNQELDTTDLTDYFDCEFSIRK